MRLSRFATLALASSLLVLAAACGSSEPNVGGACSSGSDCDEGAYCVLLDGAKSGTCHAVPSSCGEPVKCTECQALEDPCGDRMEHVCVSGFGQVTMSCK